MPRQQTRRTSRAAAPPQVQETESRAQKFRRLGEARITRAINGVRLVGNLASPNYEYTEQDALKILGVLEEAVDSVRQKFLRKKGKHTLSFSWEEEHHQMAAH